jgi:hypothetical protein
MTIEGILNLMYMVDVMVLGLLLVREMHKKNSEAHAA